MRVFGRRSSSAVVAGALGVAACGHGAADPAATRAAGYAALARGVSAAYSFRFIGPFPGGAYAHFGLLASAPSTACVAYSGTSSTADGWILDVQFGGMVAGTYAVTTESVVGPQTDRANVAMILRRGGEYVQNYPAVGGTVTLAADLTLDGARGTSSVGATIHALFPRDAVRQLGCQGEQQRDSATASTTCTCQNDDGGTFTCVPDAGFDYCCAGGDQIPFDAQVIATPCPGMCRVAAGLPDYCSSVTP